MIPYEDMFDDPNYLVPGPGTSGSGLPGSGAPRSITPAARVPRLAEAPELTIHEVTPCRGCGKGIVAGEFCARCGEEVESLKRLWNFETYRRPEQAPKQLPVGPWTPGTACCAILAVAATVWAFVVLTPLIADWIAGGPR